MAGWIKLHRQILDNPIICKDSDYYAIWSYLLLNATHSEIPMLFGGKKIILKKGQLITGRKVIAAKFNISESKVQRVLKSFKSEQQIEQQTTNKNRLVTILNWELYQESEQQIEQQVNNKWTTSEQRVNTNKNDKNVKNDGEGTTTNSELLKKWNTKCLLKNIRSITKKRSLSVNARLREHGEDSIDVVIENINNSSFLKGQNNQSWVADFDWVMKPSNYIKILEGKYDEREVLESEHF